MRHSGDITNQYKLNNLPGQQGVLLENTIANIKVVHAIISMFLNWKAWFPVPKLFNFRCSFS